MQRRGHKARTASLLAFSLAVQMLHVNMALSMRAFVQCKRCKTL